MLFNNLAKKVCVIGLCLSVMASPLALANNSIELNQDRSAGHGLIAKPQSQKTSAALVGNSIELNQDRSAGHGVMAKPQSHTTSVTAAYTQSDLLYDKGDRRTDQEFMAKVNGQSARATNYALAD